MLQHTCNHKQPLMLKKNWQISWVALMLQVMDKVLHQCASCMYYMYVDGDLSA